MPSTYPVAQRLPGRISSMLLSAFSIAMLPPVQEFAIWLCDCKAREALSMLPFTEDTFGTPTPDVFERVHLANPPWESTGFKSDVFLPAKMVTRVLEWCSVQSWSAIVAAKSFSWSKEVHSSSLAVDTAGSVFGHKEFSWHDYAHDEDDFSVPASMHHFEDGKCLYIIDREGSPGDKSLFLSAPQYVAKFTDAPSYTMRGQDLLDYFFTVLQAIIALVKKVSSGKSKYDCDARKRARKEKDGLRSKAKPVRDKILISPEYINDKGWRHYYDDASIISVLKAMKAGVLPEASWFSPHVLFCATGNWNIAIAATICQFEVFRIMLVLNQEVTVVGLRSETLLACAKAAPSLDAAAFVDLSEADILGFKRARQRATHEAGQGRWPGGLRRGGGKGRHRGQVVLQGLRRHARAAGRPLPRSHLRSDAPPRRGGRPRHAWFVDPQRHHGPHGQGPPQVSRHCARKEPSGPRTSEPRKKRCA